MPTVIRNTPTTAGNGTRRGLQFTRGGSLIPRAVTHPAPAAAPAVATPGAPAAGADVAAPAMPAPGSAAAAQPLSQQGAPRDPRERGPNGIDPVDVVVGPSTLGSFQEHQDAAYQQATRTLDPMWEANKRRFDQDMINRGITPGSEAYDLALAQHERSRTDAYDTAQRNAVEVGQRAQAQAYDQAYRESQLANELLRQREGNQTSIDIAGIGAGASMYGNDMGRLNFLDQLGFNQQQAADDRNRWDLGFDRAGDQWNQNFAREGDQWDRQFGLGMQNSDFEQMMRMNQFDRDTVNMNNGAGSNDLRNIISLFGLMPQAQGAGGIDYMGALGMNQSQQNANYQTGVQNANQNNANYAAILTTLFCDENAKEIGAPVQPEKCLAIVLDLPLVEFTYSADVTHTRCVGTTAQAFNTALHGEPAPGGLAVIKIMDLLGVLLGAVKALDARMQALEAA